MKEVVILGSIVGQVALILFLFNKPLIEVWVKIWAAAVSIVIPSLFVGWVGILYGVVYIRDVPGLIEVSTGLLFVIPFPVFWYVFKKFDRAWVAFLCTQQLVLWSFRPIMEDVFSVTNAAVIIVTYLIGFCFLAIEERFVRWLKRLDFEKLAHRFVSIPTETSTP